MREMRERRAGGDGDSSGAHASAYRPTRLYIAQCTPLVTPPHLRGHAWATCQLAYSGQGSSGRFSVWLLG
jgi:hypothetical protein